MGKVGRAKAIRGKALRSIIGYDMHIHAMNGTNTEEARTQVMLACLAVPSRYRLVRAIAEADRCVGELAVSVGLSQSCTTRHLQALERAGLVKGRRDGRRVRFSLAADAEDSRSVLGLVLGDEGATGHTAAGVNQPEATRSRRRERATSTERRRKQLTGSDLGTSDDNRSGRGRAVQDSGSPPGVSGTQELPMTTRPSRRQDMEDYLL